MKNFFVLAIVSLLIFSCSNDYKEKLTATAWHMVKMEFSPDSSNTTAPPWMVVDYIEDPYVEFRANDTCYQLFSKVQYSYRLEGNKMYMGDSKDDAVIRTLTSDMLVIDIHVDSLGTYTNTYKAVPFNHHPFDAAICALSKKYMVQNYIAEDDSFYVFGVLVSPKQMEEEGDSVAEDIKARIGEGLNTTFVEEKNRPTDAEGFVYNGYTWVVGDFSVVLKNYFRKGMEAELPIYLSSEVEMRKIR